MKKIHLVTAFAALLSLGASLRADDTVVLNDGTALTGQVMEETSDHVILMDHGIQRTLERGLVAKVEFNTSPSSSDSATAPDASGGNTVPSAPSDAAAAPADGGNTVPSAPSDAAAAPADGGNTVPTAPTEDEQDYAAGVSAYYQIPSDQVWGFEQQGIPYEELPVVFYVARHAQCAPGLVVSLRMSGMSWADICMHFGLNPGIFYWRNLSNVNLGGPYAGIYLNFRRYPHRSWSWDLLALSDVDIINCVNLRFETAYWHFRPYDVARWRGLGHPYFWGGYGFGRAYARSRGRWGAGRQRGQYRSQGRVRVQQRGFGHHSDGGNGGGNGGGGEHGQGNHN